MPNHLSSCCGGLAAQKNHGSIRSFPRTHVYTRMEAVQLEMNVPSSRKTVLNTVTDESHAVTQLPVVVWCVWWDRKMIKSHSPLLLESSLSTFFMYRVVIPNGKMLSWRKKKSFLIDEKKSIDWFFSCKLRRLCKKGVKSSALNGMDGNKNNHNDNYLHVMIKSRMEHYWMYTTYQINRCGTALDEWPKCGEYSQIRCEHDFWAG